MRRSNRQLWQLQNFKKMIKITSEIVDDGKDEIDTAVPMENDKAG